MKQIITRDNIGKHLNITSNELNVSFDFTYDEEGVDYKVIWPLTNYGYVYNKVDDNYWVNTNILIQKNTSTTINGVTYYAFEKAVGNFPANYKDDLNNLYIELPEDAGIEGRELSYSGYRNDFSYDTYIHDIILTSRDSSQPVTYQMYEELLTVGAEHQDIGDAINQLNQDKGYNLEAFVTNKRDVIRVSVYPNNNNQAPLLEETTSTTFSVIDPNTNNIIEEEITISEDSLSNKYYFTPELDSFFNPDTKETDKQTYIQFIKTQGYISNIEDENFVLVTSLGFPIKAISAEPKEGNEIVIAGNHIGVKNTNTGDWIDGFTSYSNNYY